MLPLLTITERKTKYAALLKRDEDTSTSVASSLRAYQGNVIIEVTSCRPKQSTVHHSNQRQ